MSAEHGLTTIEGRHSETRAQSEVPPGTSPVDFFGTMPPNSFPNSHPSSHASSRAPSCMLDPGTLAKEGNFLVVPESCSTGVKQEPLDIEVISFGVGGVAWKVSDLILCCY